MNKLIIIGACIAGILGILDILNTPYLRYGAIALLGYTAFITLNELNPPKGQVIKQPQTQTREKPKDIWDEFEPTHKGEKESQEKKLKFKIEDTSAKQDKIQNPAEVQKTG